MVSKFNRSVASVSSSSNTHIPQYFVIRGRLKGPVVMVTAGIHGTEVAGMMVARTLRNLKILRGTLIIVPLVNSMAYQKHVRGRPDVNRSFPRHRNDKARTAIARHVFRLAKRYRPHWCFDLHEANGLYRLDRRKLGQTIIVYPDEAAERVARRVMNSVNHNISKKKQKFAVLRGELAGSFRTSAGKILGAHALTVETCIQLPRKSRVEYQTMIVRRLLEEAGIL